MLNLFSHILKLYVQAC